MTASNVTEYSQSATTPKKPAGKRRSFTGGMSIFITVLTVTLALFQLGTAFFGQLPAMQQRSFHVSLVLPLVFLLYPATKGSPRDRVPFYDWILTLLAFSCSFYTFVFYEDIVLRGGIIYEYELALAACFTLLIFEGARRVLGLFLPAFCFMFLLFGYFGRYMPGPLQHFGLDVSSILEELYLTTDGFFGIVCGVSATYIYLFVLFGAFLASTKASDFFNDFSMAIAGHYKGGPAKISVLSSALMGTISGSTSANVATTGAFTIPLMKQIGYEAHFAGAVSAAASTGGQIMPPVMGAAAFIIADTLGISYTIVLVGAIVPALLYFWGIWCSLSLEASRLGLQGLPKETLPNLMQVLKRSGYKSIPLFVIVYLLVRGYNPLYSGCLGILACIILSFVKKSDRMTPKTFIATLENGSKGALSVAMACIVVGAVIGMLGATGVAMRMGDAVLSFTQGNLIATLVITFIIATLLGMGMPTSASYVMASAVAAPALVALGVVPLNAHLFVFFYAILSSVTPPVCTGVYTAAGIAEANPNKTAFASIKLALPGFIIPFIFVLAPEILLTNVTNWFVTIQAMVTAIIGVFLVACTTENYMMAPLKWYERILTAAGALALIYPGTMTDIAGIAIFVLVYFMTRQRKTA